MLIFDPTDREIWNVKLEPVDSPPVGTMTPDLDAAVTTALRDRADLLRARKDIDTSAASIRYTNNQRLPETGGTQVLRASKDRQWRARPFSLPYGRTSFVRDTQPGPAQCGPRMYFLEVWNLNDVSASNDVDLLNSVQALRTAVDRAPEYSRRGA